MKFKNARTCEGCKAFNSSPNAVRSCELDFKNYGGYNAKLGINILKPQEPCLKPLTIPELFEAQEFKRQLDGRA